MVCAMAPDPGNVMTAQAILTTGNMDVMSTRQIEMQKMVMDRMQHTQTMTQDKIQHTENKIADTKENTQRRMERLRDKIEKFLKSMQAINKFFKTLALFYPLIIVLTGIIIIATNSLIYVLMAIAWLLVAFARTIYALVSLPPFIYILFYIFWFFVVFIPFLAYTAIFVVLLVFIFVICLILAFLDTIFDLKKLLLCQNSPGVWYHTPSYQLRNQYERGLFCSRPCAKGYSPDSTGQRCERLPKGQPDFCPKAEIMRIYTGVGRKDKNYVYGDFNMKGNLRFLQKPPAERESVLLDYFISQQKFQSGCNNKIEARYGFENYNPLLSSICSSLDGAEKEKLLGLSPIDVKRLKGACNKAFCSAKTSYPFCIPFADSSSSDMSDLIRQIILTIIAVMVFVFCMLFITYHAVAH
jgi:hypothetical protein